MTKYRVRSPRTASPPEPGPNPDPASYRRTFPHWFGAELRQILVKHPEAYQTVCQWLAELEARGEVIYG